jgi:hypothetical protein
LFSLRIFHEGNAICDGDLNFILYMDESGGDLEQEDKLLHRLEAIGLIDVEMIEITLTWCNNKVGNEGIRK